MHSPIIKKAEKKFEQNEITNENFNEEPFIKTDMFDITKLSDEKKEVSEVNETNNPLSDTREEQKDSDLDIIIFSNNNTENTNNEPKESVVVENGAFKGRPISDIPIKEFVKPDKKQRKKKK